MPSDASLLEDAPDGAVQEVNEAALGFAAWLGARLKRHGGAALLIDYGPAESAFGDSLQVFSTVCPLPGLTGVFLLYVSEGAGTF